MKFLVKSIKTRSTSVKAKPSKTTIIYGYVTVHPLASKQGGVHAQKNFVPGVKKMLLVLR